MNPARLPIAESLLDELAVADAMHHGLVTCAPTATLREVAGLLAEHGVHCAVVADGGADDAGSVWGIVSDLDLMRGLGSPIALTAGNLAAARGVTVGPRDELSHAAQLMAEHDTSHLIVVADDRPVGILSTLDVARAAARA
jgi:CBS domain-containing protein